MAPRSNAPSDRESGSRAPSNIRGSAAYRGSAHPARSEPKAVLGLVHLTPLSQFVALRAAAGRWHGKLPEFAQARRSSARGLRSAIRRLQDRGRSAGRGGEAMPTAVEDKDAIREVMAEYCFRLDDGR